MALSDGIPAYVTMTWLPEFEGLVKFASRPLTQVNADIFENINQPLPKPEDGKCRLLSAAVRAELRQLSFQSRRCQTPRKLLCASQIGKGINGGVCLQANPKSVTWLRAGVRSIS